MSNKVGRIIFTGEFLRESTVDQRTSIFSKFHPYAIYPGTDRDTYEYYGVCEEFDEVEPGEDTPLYHIVIKDVHGATIISFDRIGPQTLRQAFPLTFN